MLWFEVMQLGLSFVLIYHEAPVRVLDEPSDHLRHYAIAALATVTKRWLITCVALWQVMPFLKPARFVIACGNTHCV